jgi:hypothetical protein
MTNAHVVADQSLVMVRKHGSAIKFIAEVEHVGHDCDLVRTPPHSTPLLSSHAIPACTHPHQAILHLRLTGGGGGGRGGGGGGGGGGAGAAGGGAGLGRGSYY